MTDFRFPFLDQYDYAPDADFADTKNCGLGENDVPVTAGANRNWSSPNAPATSSQFDRAEVSSDESGDVHAYLRLSNFGLNVPAGVDIWGVEVLMEGSWTDIGNGDHMYVEELRLAYDPLAATVSPNNGATPGNPPVSGPLTRFGANNDTFGFGTLTPAIVNSADFSVLIKAAVTNNNSGFLARVERLGVVVWYAYPSTTGAIRMTQNYAEVLGDVAKEPVRLTQLYAEVLGDVAKEPVRLTQLYAEVITTNDDLSAGGGGPRRRSTVIGM